MSDQTRTSRLSSREMALLAGLADGALAGRRRARAQRLVEALPDGELLVERQRRVARVVSGDRPPAREAPRRSAVPVPRWRVGLAGALAALVAAFGLVQLTGGASTVSRAADLAHAHATRPAPHSDGTVLAAAVDGVAFPDWARKFGWHATGLRRDRLDGRPTRTVFYEHMGHRIAYTILSGKPLPLPDDATVMRRDGLRIAAYRDGGHEVAVFERGGHTCVLAGHVLRRTTLLELAAWRGDGAVRG